MAKKLEKPSPKSVDALRRVLTLPGVSTIVKLARDCAHLSTKSSEHASRAGKLISETKNIHSGAFRLGLRFYKMEEKNRAIFLAHFDHVREVLKLDEIKQKDFDFSGDDKDKKKKKNGPDIAAAGGLNADDQAAEEEEGTAEREGRLDHEAGEDRHLDH